MRKGFILSLVASLITVLFWISVPTGCANIVPPSGGPRDSLPPVLLNASPPDSTINFRGNQIVFTFDEELDDPRDTRNNLIFTPTFEREPEISTRGKVLTLKFLDTLEANTTYVINFGESVIDITEGNAVKNFTYAFSTGPVLDSLEISGRVLLAENGQVDSTLIVVLHKDLADTAVRDRRPQYVTKLDRNGYFRFGNLPKDTFAIYAIGDAAIGQRYQRPPGQVFAFNNTPVVAGESDSLLLYGYKEVTSVSATATAATTRIPANDRRLRFTPGTTGQQELMEDFVLTFPVPLRTFDSSKIHLATDSVFTPASFTAAADSSNRVVRIKTQWKEGTSYHLILEQDFATDTSGRQLLKTDTVSFVTKKREDYGSVSFRAKNVDSSRNPVVQFVLNGKIVFSTSIKSGVFREELFQPGEYSVRILYDTNGNGQWDPGKFFGQKRQPELVELIERPFTVKPNWDNEFEVLL